MFAIDTERLNVCGHEEPKIKIWVNLVEIFYERVFNFKNYEAVSNSEFLDPKMKFWSQLRTPNALNYIGYTVNRI